MRKIIAITGIKGSGKDSIADYIIKNYDNWEKDSFAGTLKDAVSVIFGWDRKMLAGETPEDRAIREQKDEYWSNKFGREITPRNMLQFFGTECLRNNLHKNIWVDSLEHKITNSNKNIIITDCRFKNEIDMLRAKGAFIVRVQRPPLPDWFDKVVQVNSEGCLYNEKGIVDLVPETKGVHISELDWIGYDNPNYIINNDGTFDELYNQIKEIMKDINNA